MINEKEILKTEWPSVYSLKTTLWLFPFICSGRVNSTEALITKVSTIVQFYTQNNTYTDKDQNTGIKKNNNTTIQYIIRFKMLESFKIATLREKHSAVY